MSDNRSEWLRTMPLEPWLDVGDPLAEAVVTEFRSRRIGLIKPIPAIRQLALEGNTACADFIRDLESPPEWVDFDIMRLGGAMAYRYSPILAVALLHGGLMTTFSSADAAYILARTNRLEQNVTRRIFESGPLFFGVLAPDALRPGGPAWETCVHVRLMHSMVRLQLSQDGSWPLRGVPINALHTSAGPLFFGAMVLDRLRSLGALITAPEADGYYLIWRYVTRLLGVPRELLGDNAEEQEVLDSRVLPYSFEPDDNSRKLAGILLSGLGTVPGLGLAPQSVHEVLARYMLGDLRADGMGIHKHPIGMRIVRVVAKGLKAYGWVQRVPAVGNRLERAGRDFLTTLIQRGLGPEDADYQPLAA